MPALTIVNRHYPPNPGITGESAWDLARYLIEQHGIEVVVVHIERTYDGGGAIRQPVGETHAVRPIYAGKNGLLKLVAGLLDGFLLIRRALRVRRGPLLIMTSPPMLPFWASLLLRNIPYWLWSMDLFPEGFAAEGKISPTNPVYRWIIRQTYRRPPRQLVALGPRQAAHLETLYGQPIPTTVLPCGVLMHQERDPACPAWRNPADGLIYLGYAGNVGQAHSADFLLSVIRNLDPARFRLVLALYGTKASAVLRAAEGVAGIIKLASIPRSQLHYLDVQLVSLLPEWTHIAVPSKAMSAVGAGSPVLFCGDPDSDSYGLLQEAAFLIDARQPIEPAVAAFLASLTPDRVRQGRQAAEAVAARLQQSVRSAYQTIAGLIEGYSNVR
ncbi:glycosyltransferase family 4 protein [Spirosoma luteolum]